MTSPQSEHHSSYGTQAALETQGQGSWNQGREWNDLCTPRCPGWPWLTKDYPEVIEGKMFKLHCPDKCYIFPVPIVHIYFIVTGSLKGIHLYLQFLSPPYFLSCFKFYMVWQQPLLLALNLTDRKPRAVGAGMFDIVLLLILNYAAVLLRSLCVSWFCRLHPLFWFVL